MLTNEERKWLQERGDSPLFQCEKYCEYHVGKDSYFECTYSPALSQEWCKNDAGNQDWKDAAEFEARVAAYIAFWSQIMSCPTRAGCKAQSILECVACWLKHARIVVEKEME